MALPQNSLELTSGSECDLRFRQAYTESANFQRASKQSSPASAEQVSLMRRTTCERSGTDLVLVESFA